MPTTAFTDAQKPMIRTQIYLTAAQKERMEGIAREDGVALAEVIRRAIDAYEPAMSDEDAKLLEAMADEVIEAIAETSVRIEETLAAVKETHRELREHRYGDR